MVTALLAGTRLDGGVPILAVPDAGESAMAGGLVTSQVYACGSAKPARAPLKSASPSAAGVIGCGCRGARWAYAGPVSAAVGWAQPSR
ncbi:hypothetical protein GCM10012279_09190 [Micromonospora yangpuensis]|nr:hypothetical protein GCM10012279_09190 [Micromonospora yangpuensis]